MLLHVVFVGLSIVIGYVLQSTVLGMIPYLNVVPNLMLIVTMTFAVLRGRREGMAVGLACGLLQDIGGGGLIGFYALIYLYIGYVNGLLSRFLTEDLLLVPLGLCIVDELFYSVYVYVFQFLLQRRLDFTVYFTGTIMSELVITLITTIFVYGLLMYLNGKLTAYQRKRDVKFG